nr:MAG TPA: hypothetical protein [Caudoviricetes sp.]
MDYAEIALVVTSRAACRDYDTTVGRAFFRAVGVRLSEPAIAGTIVSCERYAGIEELMAQRHGIAY